jgi:hypothetical protein
MAKAWPRLSLLNISLNVKHSTATRPPLTLSGIVSLVHECACLRNLSITVDASNPLATQARCRRPKLKLNLCGSWISDHVALAIWLESFCDPSNISLDEWDSDPKRSQIWEDTKLLMGYLTITEVKGKEALSEAVAARRKNDTE